MHKNRIPYSVGPLLAAALLSTAMLVSGCGGGGDAKAEDGGGKGPEAVPVEDVELESRAIDTRYNKYTTLEPQSESTEVVNPTCRVREVLVEVGQAVRAGQPLVRLDADRARLQAAQSAAQLRKLEANHERARQLAAQQMVSANDLDQLRFDLENARATNRLANLELSYTTV